MSRRRASAVPAASAAPVVTDASPCPCGLPAGYAACCGRFHRGAGTAPSAELLMRSRFSAFAVRDAAYLLRTWHPDTRPADLDLADGPTWVRLEVLGSTEGGPFHSEGTVEFRAHWREGRQSGVLAENSRFTRVDGAWVYVEALTLDEG